MSDYNNIHYIVKKPIHSVQTVFNVDSVQEFEELVTLCGWTLQREDESGLGLTIVGWQSGAKIDIRPNLKGLIYNTSNGRIMAPGVPIPLESKPAEDPVGYSCALDGIMFRLWYEDSGKFKWSTNGKITPGSWRGVDLNFLMEKCIFSLKQINLDALDPNLCYLVVLEDPSIPNIYRADNPTVTLIRVLTADGADVKMTDEVCRPFTYINVMMPGLEPGLTPDQVQMPGPVTRNNFGLIAHYQNGDTYRILSDNAKNAEMFRPNFSNVWQHWIYHAQGSTPDLLNFGALEWYKLYFPWHAAEIDGLTACFKAIVPPPEQEEILASSKCLKRVVVDTYQKVMKEVNCTRRNLDGSVTVPYLGNFPDDESADYEIELVLKDPASLFSAKFFSLCV